MAIACLATAVLAAGCGDDPLASFRERQLQPLEARVDQQRAKLAALLRVVRPGSHADAEAVRQATGPLAASARQAAVLDPPSQAARAKRTYAAALAALTRELDRFSHVLESDGTTALDRAATRVRNAVGGLEEATIAFDRSVAG